MQMRLIPALVLALALSACQGPTTPPTTRPPFAVAQTATAEARVLVEGDFTLPATLVSVGSGSLVSVGSGHIVSVGSGNYRLAAVSGDVPVAGAVVALLPSRGLGLGAKAAQTTTDAQGHYRLTGAAVAGIYVVDATVNGHHYRSLAAVRDAEVAQAAIDVATTMVTSRLLAEKHGEGLDVLPTQRFAETVQAVRQAIATHGLPEGFTPEAADAALALLEQQEPAVARAVSDLEAEQARLEERYSQLAYQVQSMAAALGLPPAAIAAEVRAALSENPQASDEEVTQQVKASSTKPSPAATPAPATPASAAPTPAPTAAPATPAPGAPAATPEPAADQADNGVSKDPDPTPRPKPTKKPGQGQGNGQGNGHQPLPSPAPSATPFPSPSAAPSASPAPAATPSASATPAPTPTPQATPTPGKGNGGGKGTPDEHANDNADGKGNAYGHDK